jgi:quercetin dioxygenase-like cupin family protein
MIELFRIDDPAGGIPRLLAKGMETTLFQGEKAMVSVARLEPGSEGTPHSHPEEQWGFCLEGSAIRYQGDEVVEVRAGHFWRTPPDVVHTIKAGPEGALIVDIFAPPREAYLKPGSGFGG